VRLTVGDPRKLVSLPAVSDTYGIMAREEQTYFPWRGVILGGLTAVLFFLAIYFYDNFQLRLGLGLLGITFTVPMVWVILAAREAEYDDSPLRNFVPRMTIWIVLGSVVLGIMQWNVDRQITAMEAGFALFYLIASFIAMRILNGRPKRPQLTALAGGNIERRQRRRPRQAAR